MASRSQPPMDDSFQHSTPRKVASGVLRAPSAVRHPSFQAPGFIRSARPFPGGAAHVRDAFPRTGLPPIADGLFSPRLIVSSRVRLLAPPAPPRAQGHAPRLVSLAPCSLLSRSCPVPLPRRRRHRGRCKEDRSGGVAVRSTPRQVPAPVCWPTDDGGQRIGHSVSACVSPKGRRIGEGWQGKKRGASCQTAPPRRPARRRARERFSGGAERSVRSPASQRACPAGKTQASSRLARTDLFPARG